MEAIIFFVCSVLLVLGYVHEDRFVRLERRLFGGLVVLASLSSKKILQWHGKYAKLKADSGKGSDYAGHIKRLQGIGTTVCQQARKRNARRAG